MSDARPYYAVIPARTVQPGDELVTGAVVTSVRPGPGKSVRIGTDSHEGYAVEHMDAPVRIKDRTFGRAALGVEGEPALCPCTDIAGSGKRGAPDPDCDECEGSGAALGVEGDQGK